MATRGGAAFVRTLGLALPWVDAARIAYWLHAHGLIGTGPRSPQRGAPYTFVATQRFLVVFGLDSLDDLLDLEQIADAGLVSRR